MANPLHTNEFINQFWRSQGHGPGRRATGRSTAQAFALLSICTMFPRSWYEIRDHHMTPKADEHLMYMIKDIVDRLGLQHFVFDHVKRRMAFGQPA